MAALLEVTRVTKSFGPTKALRDASLSLRAGEIHALVGENGAGKSTLMKILSGVHQADSGQVLLDGQVIHPTTPNEARRLGISTVFQELSLCPNLSVAENIYANREPTTLGFVRRHALNSFATTQLQEFQIPITAETPVADLKLAQKQIVEILKAVSVSAKVLILDEPTSALERTEAHRLFDLLMKLKRGGAGIVFITHKLDEVFRVADRITVFRDGEYITTKDRAETNQDDVIRYMVGRDIHQIFPAKGEKRGRVRLKIADFSFKEKFSNIAFTAYESEILGVAGLTGSGRSETMQSVFGSHVKESGEIVFEGNPVTIESPHTAIRNNIVYSPEDRKEQGLFLHHSVTLNVTATCLEECSTSGFLSRKKENEVTSRMIKDLSIKVQSIDQEVRLLSGGNQQKILLAKCLASHPKVLIVDEPTRGIDIGSKIEIYKLLRDFANRGGTVILISSDLPEIIGLSDRVLVFKEGRVMGELAGQITENAVMELMFKRS